MKIIYSNFERVFLSLLIVAVIFLIGWVIVGLIKGGGL